MLYKTYGKTGKSVSVIGFGGMRFPGPQDIDVNADLLLYAYNKGINYFDTAPYYCDDRSEESLGAAIKHFKPGTFYVSTKCGEADGRVLRESLDRSLKRLGLSKIHFFHIWCLVRPGEWEERVTGGAVTAAFKAKEEGLVEHVVVSSHLQGDHIRNLLRREPIEGVTLGYCAINFPYRQAAVDAAAELGRGIATMNPLGGGIIPRESHRFEFLRGPRDRSVVEAALRFNISQPGITLALVGFSSKSQVDEACVAVENFVPYPQTHIESVRGKILQSVGSAHPANDGCVQREDLGCRRPGADHGSAQVALASDARRRQGMYAVRYLRGSMYATSAHPGAPSGDRGHRAKADWAKRISKPYLSKVVISG
jgi:hypothetical protein